jgi:hypothetical protein
MKMIGNTLSLKETRMGSAIPLGEFKNVMLDIDSELDYWRRNYGQAAFHRTARTFEQYLPTLKFGYDMYLLNHGDGLDDLLPVMRARYEATMEGDQSLDWPLAEAVIRETWKRMRPQINHRAKGAGDSLIATPAARLLRPAYQSV